MGYLLSFFCKLLPHKVELDWVLNLFEMVALADS
jgi:hypothetical protein